MRITTLRNCGLVAASLLLAGTAQAFDFGNMMNPSKWMGGKDKNDRYYDDYGPGYGYPGGYGPGYGGPGLEYGPGYGYGEPGYGPGYGGPGYGAPGYGGPGYGAPAYGNDPGYGWSYGPDYSAPAGGAPAYSAPPPADTGNAEEIKRLKERIRKLEQSSQQQPAVWGQPGYDYR
ncbi:MAG: hypothetical protein R3F42_11980 [Pseudomonadota bacterium]